MPKPTERILDLAQDLIAEASEEWSADEASEFLDALNPQIRKHLILAYMKGDRRNRYVVRDHSHVGTTHKINAIRSWRAITRDGLREAKEAIERAEHEKVEIPKHVDPELRRQLSEDLKGTGWIVK